MNAAARTPKPFVIRPADLPLLQYLNTLRYLTASQLQRLLYSPGSRSYAQERLKPLADHGYVLALPRPFQTSPTVYTLAAKGRAVLQEGGITVSPYYRPAEERQKAASPFFLSHTLAVNDVLISALLLERQQSRISLIRLLIERELKAMKLRATVPIAHDGIRTGTREQAVIPDAFLQLSIDGGKPYSICLEVDRDTEERVAWSAKVAALSAWVAGPYQAQLQTDNVTLAVVAPTRKRVAELLAWTEQELTRHQLRSLASLFLFTAADPVTTSPAAFFTAPLWHTLDDAAPLPLLEGTPEAAQAFSPASSGTVAWQRSP